MKADGRLPITGGSFDRFDLRFSIETNSCICSTFSRFNGVFSFDTSLRADGRRFAGVISSSSTVPFGRLFIESVNKDFFVDLSPAELLRVTNRSARHASLLSRAKRIGATDEPSIGNSLLLPKSARRLVLLSVGVGKRS